LVRITTTTSLAEAFLIPHLAAFREQHPGIDVEILAETRIVSLPRREADLALRYARPETGELIARRLATLGFGFYANAAWRARLAADEDPVFVGFDEANAQLPEAVWLARRFAGHRLALRANSQISQAKAALAGHGIALLPHFIGGADRGLSQIFLAETPPAREIWLLARRDGLATLPIRLARDFLIVLFRREQDLFEWGRE
jgi:DNA-binding transcriptional LysR family regulator